MNQIQEERTEGSTGSTENKRTPERIGIPGNIIG